MREVTRKSIIRTCKICHKKTRRISQNGNCVKCSANLVTSANYQMKTKLGPAYDKWRKKIEAGLSRS